MSRWFCTRLLTVILQSLIIIFAMGCRRTPSPSDPPPERAPQRVREPAVAGTFYPGQVDTLRSTVDELLESAVQHPSAGLRALIAPHAGYRYSGPVAASGFRALKGRAFQRVVVMAPSHRVRFEGAALPDVDAFSTPLGNIPLAAGIKQLASSGPFVLESEPHEHEHSLEVELPFLQRALGSFELIPVVFGDVDESQVADGLARYVEPKTFFVASSDLSHYHPYVQAKALDQATVDAILSLDVKRVAEAEACGKGPILALLYLAKKQGWKPVLLDLRNSGDITSDKSRVVGYASIGFYDGQA